MGVGTISLPHHTTIIRRYRIKVKHYFYITKSRT